MYVKVLACVDYCQCGKNSKLTIKLNMSVNPPAVAAKGNIFLIKFIT